MDVSRIGFKSDGHRDAQNRRGQHIGEVVALQGDARPHHGQRINRRDRSPAAMNQPGRGRESDRRRRVAGGKGTEFVFTNEPMTALPDAVKALRRVARRPRAPEEHAQNRRRQAGQQRNRADKKNMRRQAREVHHQKDHGEEYPHHRHHPALADLGTPPRQPVQGGIPGHVERGIHAEVQRPRHRDRHRPGEQPEIKIGGVTPPRVFQKKPSPRM